MLLYFGLCIAISCCRMALCYSQPARETDGISSPLSSGDESLYIHFAARKYGSVVKFVIFSINGGGAGVVLCKRYS